MLGRELPSIIDMLVVDGPRGSILANGATRAPARTLFDRLDPSATVYLDDVDRSAEREILGDWGRLLPDRAVDEGATMAGLRPPHVFSSRFSD